ncbi:BTB/POZ domain-containing protein 6-like [Paramacrobiotus metropolitanus]|uniref:BTB/POZ domain-containing protein 6-like n=1 Tax=Paramacrobiotus metropolitanus TaxID=2943436 RepID=UPI002445B3EE|nr:BTB/POZ domain-containing protein 6-like [Paramacrobiotus metropolitanus]
MAQPSGLPIENDKTWRSSKKLHKRTAYLLDHPDSEIPNDITFVVGDGRDEPKKTFKCHKFILALVSSVFHAMFYGNFEQVEVVELPDITPFAFERMLRFAYADEWTFEDSVPLVDILSTLYCAKKYLISKLLRACRDHAQSRVVGSDPSDPIIAIEQSRFLDEEDLSDLAVAEIRYYTPCILRTAAFLQLSLESVKQILEHNCLDATEPEIYRSVCRWVKRNMDSGTVTLREGFGSLLYLIRFPLFTPVQLAEGPVEDGVFSLEEGYNLFKYAFAPSKPAVPFATVSRTSPAEAVDVLEFSLEISRSSRESAPLRACNQIIEINLRPDLAPGCIAFLKEIVGGEYFLQFGAYPNEHNKQCTNVPLTIKDRNPLSFTVKGACWFEWDIDDGKVCNLKIAAWNKPAVCHSAVFGFIENSDFVEKLFHSFSVLDEHYAGLCAVGKFRFNDD